LPEQNENLALVKFRSMALDTLKKAGYRITSARKEVIDVLGSTQIPLSAYKVKAAVIEQGGKVDVVSIYRILATFKELGIAHYLGSVDGYVACRSNAPHVSFCEHAICTECGKAVELSPKGQRASSFFGKAAEIGMMPSFACVEILGLCEDCRSKF